MNVAVRPFTSLKSYAAHLFELETGPSRILPMEGLRGMSAALVFFVHFHSLFGSRAPGALSQVSQFLWGLGNCGVQIFFALSGYIIYGMLMRKPVPYFRFVKRRIVRLYPVFIAVFLFYVCASVALPAYSKLHTARVPLIWYLVVNFLMLPGILPIVPLITVAWSLSYELTFYLTFPLLVNWFHIPAWRQPTRIAFFVALAAAGLWWPIPGLGTQSWLSMFVCGILLNETSRWRFLWPRTGAVAAASLFAISLALFGIGGTSAAALYDGQILWKSPFLMTIFFIGTFALVHFSLAYEGFLSRWFQWDWIRWFGNISYSYYLTHGIVLHLILASVQHLALPKTWPVPVFLAFFIASFAATALGGAVVFLAIEKPLSLRRQSARHASAAAAEAVAQSA
ncbi:MAG TPA: acyltransferase [Bryobacteraceae bacterium]|nr:acyltransferase [Bryobacteraceae bacterium]